MCAHCRGLWCGLHRVSALRPASWHHSGPCCAPRCRAAPPRCAGPLLRCLCFSSLSLSAWGGLVVERCSSIVTCCCPALFLSQLAASAHGSGSLCAHVASRLPWPVASRLPACGQQAAMAVVRPFCRCMPPRWPPSPFPAARRSPLGCCAQLDWICKCRRLSLVSLLSSACW